MTTSCKGYNCPNWRNDGDRRETRLLELLFSDDDESILIAEIAEMCIDEALSLLLLDVRKRVNVYLVHGGEKEAVQRHVGKAIFAVGVFKQFHTNTAELDVADGKGDEE